MTDCEKVIRHFQDAIEAIGNGNRWRFVRKDIIEDAISLLKEQVLQNGGWISVKDKLPEVGKVVLAFGTRSATTGMFQGVTARNDCWLWKGCTIKHVSHWMPLPEPPKGET